ncbi:hypothetical protein SCUCBS95973_006550 [Sporothrix curviconia]|uniref:F-box domain-containing protein n=1 Tax=Sporothrix curviconia TaxID=1260050 RepID=A0ABP0C6F5_9PEZI
MKLQDLPVEVLGEIMSAIHGPNDLQSFIAVSPGGLRVFNLFRDRILLSVALNTIEPEARDAALAIGHVPYMETNRDGQFQRAFLDSFFGNDDDVIRLPDSSDKIASFCGLVCRIQYFVDDYARGAWARLHTGDPLLSSPPLPPSSSSPPRLVLRRSELAAFQRAFFLFELYATVFPVYRSGFAKEIIGDQAQADHFLSCLGPWDLEAMSCIYFYYTRLILQHTKRVEDDFVNWILALPSRYDLTVPDRPSKRDLVQEDNGEKEKTGRLSDELRAKLLDWDWHFFYNLDYELHRIVLFSRQRRDHYQLGDLALMLSLRSAFAYRLVHARRGDEEARARLVIGGDLYRFRDGFIDDAAQLARRQHSGGDNARSNRSNTSNNRSCPALTFFRAVDHDWLQHAVGLDRATNSAVRDRAHAFWDTHRLQQPSIAASLEQASILTAVEGEKLYESDFGSSVQERLDGVGVHNDDFRPLMRRIRGEWFYDGQDKPGFDDVSESEVD